MAQRFCGTGRKWCGKICIDARSTCRKGSAANAKQFRIQKSKRNIKKAGFKKIR